MSEHIEQCTVFTWATLYEPKYPCLKYMFSTLNGIRLTIGSAVKAKKSGNKKGVPDIVLPKPMNNYHGLYIELKVGKNKTSEDQNDFIEYLRIEGYKVEVAYGSIEAIDFIKDYLEGN